MSTLTILFLALFAYAYQNRSPEYDRALTRMEDELKTDARGRTTAARNVDFFTALLLVAGVRASHANAGASQGRRVADGAK